MPPIKHHISQRIPIVPVALNSTRSNRTGRTGAPGHRPPTRSGHSVRATPAGRTAPPARSPASCDAVCGRTGPARWIDDPVLHDDRLAAGQRGVEHQLAHHHPGVPVHIQLAQPAMLACDHLRQPLGPARVPHQNPPVGAVMTRAQHQPVGDLGQPAVPVDLDAVVVAQPGQAAVGRRVDASEQVLDGFAPRFDDRVRAFGMRRPARAAAAGPATSATRPAADPARLPVRRVHAWIRHVPDGGARTASCSTSAR